MKRTGLFFLGYGVFIAGLLAVLWKTGVLASIGTAWTLIGLVIAVGLGIMYGGSSKGMVQIERKGE